MNPIGLIVIAIWSVPFVVTACYKRFFQAPSRVLAFAVYIVSGLLAAGGNTLLDWPLWFCIPLLIAGWVYVCHVIHKQWADLVLVPAPPEVPELTPEPTPAPKLDLSEVNQQIEALIQQNKR